MFAMMAENIDHRRWSEKMTSLRGPTLKKVDDLIKIWDSMMLNFLNNLMNISMIFK